LTASLVVTDVKKIAILRSGALGDFIVILPAINAIRNTYPHAEIVLIGKPWLKAFLIENRTEIDRFIEAPILKGIREEQGKKEDPHELQTFLQAMRKESFDIVIQFQGKGIAANPFIKQFEAKLTVGFTSPESEELDRSILYYYYQSESLRYLEVAGLIGAEPVSCEPVLAILSEDLEEAESFLSKIEYKPFIVLHPFALDIRRSWPLEKFCEVADILFERGFQIIFSGSQEDKDRIDDGINQMIYPAINSSGRLSLSGLIGLMAKSELVISSDTGPLHLARAIGAKTVGIYWAPNLINWGPLFRNKHRPVISWKMECPLCGIVPNNPFPYEPRSVTCSHNLSFVQNIGIEQVLKEVDELTNRNFKTVNGEGQLRR
jgi:ADP-heptose:LPS heptosyltransferase